MVENRLTLMDLCRKTRVDTKISNIIEEAEEVLKVIESDEKPWMEFETFEPTYKEEKTRDFYPDLNNKNGGK